VGNVFKVSKTGAFTNLYHFKGGNDGGNPDGGLVRGPMSFYGSIVEAHGLTPVHIRIAAVIATLEVVEVGKAPVLLTLKTLPTSYCVFPTSSLLPVPYKNPSLPCTSPAYGRRHRHHRR